MQAQGQAAADRWDQTFNQGDMASLAQLYASDASVIPAGGSPVHGADGIGQFFADLHEKGFRDHKITVQEATPRGDMLILTGHWQLNGPGEAGATQTYQGNWVNVLARQGADWRTVLHTWN
jgi:uncharacterized protein (TIGR02246 family)